MHVLRDYGLGRISFVNVFSGATFSYRAYVRKNKVVPLRDTILPYDLDHNLTARLVSDSPILGLARILQLAENAHSEFKDIVSGKPLVYHTSQKSNQHESE